MKLVHQYHNDRCFRYFECSIRVRSDDPSALEWLHEFLAPAFEVEDSANHCEWSVRVVISSDWFDELQCESSRSCLNSFDCFTLDNQFTVCQGWVRHNRQRVLYDRQYQTYYIISENGRTVDFVVREQSRRYRVGLMRVIREMATIHCLQTGRVQIHAACYGRHHRAMVLAGHRRSGKTTWLLHALQYPEHFLIANDRVFVDCNTHEPVVRGMPTIVHIRRPGLEYFPELNRRFNSRRFHHSYMIKELSIEPSAIPQPEAPSLTQIQLCNMLETTSRSSGNLAAIVLPRINSNSVRSQMQRLAQEDAVRELRQRLFFSSAPERLSSAFTELDSPGVCDQDSVQVGCRQIVEMCDVFQCDLGLHAYRNRHLLDLLWSENSPTKRNAA